MGHSIERYGECAYLVADPDFVLSAGNVNDLLSACYEMDGSLVLLRESNVPPEFFDLSTRLAGEILQKFTNYSVRAVLIVPTLKGRSDRFVEMASESTRKADFGVFTNEDEAVKWLCHSR